MQEGTVPAALPPLAACFASLCEWQGVELARLEAAGLAEDCTPAQLEEIAARVGLHLRVVRRKLERLPALGLPVLACLKSGGCVLQPVAGESGPQWQVSWPEASQVPVFSSIPGIQGSTEDRSEAVADLRRDYLGYLMVLGAKEQTALTEDRLAGRGETGGAAWWLRNLAGIRGDMAFIVIASICIHVVALGLPMLTMTVYNRVVPTGANETLWVLVAAATGAYVFDFVVRILRSRFSDAAAKTADRALAGRLIHHTLTLELAARPASAGTLAGRLRHYETVRDFLTSATVLGLVDMPFGLMLTGLIFWLAGAVGWVPLAFGALALVATISLQPWQNRLLREAYAHSLDRQALAAEVVNALETVKAANASAHMERRMLKVEELAAEADLKLKRVSHFGSSFTVLCANLASIGVIIASVFAIQEKTLSMGGMIACVMVAGRAMAPLTSAAALMMRLQQMLVSLQSLRDVLRLPGEDDRTHLHRTLTFPSFKLEQATMTYTGQPTPSLRDVSLSIKPGERIGVIGRAGSGKTTLLRLLSRSTLPTSGQVLVDGLDIGHLAPASLRAAVGYLPQDPVLLHGTLRDNILMGRGMAGGDAAMLKAAERAGVLEWANRNPKGFDAQVGERGTLLSGGERQMVAAARALLTEPGVLLLDEPTASFDITTESRFCQALAAYLADDKGRTLVMATHKLSLLSMVDRVILLEGGRVMLDGPRDQVIARLQQAQPQAQQGPSQQRRDEGVGAAEGAAATPAPAPISVPATVAGAPAAPVQVSVGAAASASGKAGTSNKHGRSPRGNPRAASPAAASTSRNT